jgi:hypothetical protein
MKTVAAALQTMESTMGKIVTGQTMPYEGALHLWQVSMGHTDSPNLMHPFWLIWGSLADMAEKYPEKKSEAETSIIRACQEWLALLPSDLDSRRQYMDRWVYEELGYERKTEPCGSTNSPTARG